MIRDPDTYFKDGCGRCGRFETDACSARVWAQGLARLRAVCDAAGLTETAKWGHPCYVHEGRNIAIIGAHRDHFSLSFFDPNLLSDPDKILQKAGPNTPDSNIVRFTDVAQVDEMKEVLSRYLAEAKGNAEAGLRPEKRAHAVDFPEELISAMDADIALAEAFHELTPGRQRSYVINLTNAKKPETRVARIEKFRPKIFAGKGANEY